jgi:hypothetical protein
MRMISLSSRIALFQFSYSTSDTFQKDKRLPGSSLVDHGGSSSSTDKMLMLESLFLHQLSALGMALGLFSHILLRNTQLTVTLP